MNSKYQDILYLSHHVSKTRKPMSVSNRAAQFAPFAALTGYEEAVHETARLTDTKVVLSMDQVITLNRKLSFLQDHLHCCPNVEITYFIPDKKKSGGCYRMTTGVIRRIDDTFQQIIMKDKTIINISDITEIHCPLFQKEGFECIS
ncbi:MAG: hypothetical protein IJ356_01865 [Erysipelotrichaceae bacterium]|nr:hypothetical protein [Erysipelotrichaceae bacterium]